MSLEGRENFSFSPIKVAGKDSKQQLIFFFFLICEGEDLLPFPVFLLLG